MIQNFIIWKNIQTAIQNYLAYEEIIFRLTWKDAISRDLWRHDKMLDFFDKDFKADIINIPQQAVVNISKMNGKDRETSNT